MKKRVAIFTIVFLLNMFNICVYATDKNIEGMLSDGMNSLLAEILDSDERSIINNKDNYKDNEVYEKVSDNAMIKVYNRALWEYSECLLEDKEEIGEKLETKDYFVLSEDIFRIRKNKFQEQIHIYEVEMNEHIPTYIEDIKSMDLKCKMGDDECILENIVCFDGSSSHMGIIVYFETNKDTYVKFYEYSNSDALLFKEEEFRRYAIQYEEYLKSPENNIGDDGTLVGGGTMTFATFYQNVNLKEYESNPFKNLFGTVNIIWYICAVVLVCFAVVIIIYRNNKNINKK